MGQTLSPAPLLLALVQLVALPMQGSHSPPTVPTVQHDPPPPNLTEFTTELLEQILILLDYDSVRVVRRTCRLLAGLAQSTLALTEWRAAGTNLGDLRAAMWRVASEPALSCGRSDIKPRHKHVRLVLLG